MRRINAVYLTHDLGDQASRRLVRILLKGGVNNLQVAGFQRTQGVVGEIEGRPAISLGRSRSGRLFARMFSIVGAVFRLGPLIAPSRVADTIICRNLEMLVIGVLLRRLSGSAAVLIYECLDIHWTQTSGRPLGYMVRFVEARLLARCAKVISSSPAYYREYFARFITMEKFELLENKAMLEDPPPPPRQANQPARAKWVIGWFGSLRCSKSLGILLAVARRLGPLVEIKTAGRPVPGVFPDFEAAIKGYDNIKFLGPFVSPEDLPALYSDIHFCWTIDYFDESNSRWLLPNRLYDGGAFGAVPIALAGSEVAVWLSERSLGITLQEPLQDSLEAFLTTLSWSDYRAAADAVQESGPAPWMHDRVSCQRLVQDLARATA